MRCGFILPCISSKVAHSTGAAWLYFNFLILQGVLCTGIRTRQRLSVVFRWCVKWFWHNSSSSHPAIISDRRIAQGRLSASGATIVCLQMTIGQQKLRCKRGWTCRVRIFSHNFAKINRSFQMGKLRLDSFFRFASISGDR